jgi:hypothetical protein
LDPGEGHGPDAKPSGVNPLVSSVVEPPEKSAKSESSKSSVDNRHFKSTSNVFHEKINGTGSSQRSRQGLDPSRRDIQKELLKVLASGWQCGIIM